MRGGSRKGAGRPKKPDHLKKKYRVHGFSAESIDLICSFAAKHSVPMSWIVDSAVQLLKGKGIQRSFGKLIREKFVDQ